MASKFSRASLSPSVAVAEAEAVSIPLADVESEIFVEICDICGQIPPWRELDKERGLCFECAGHLDEGIKYYTEEFAFASIHGKDALRLLVLRQRADNCRDLIAAAAATYDGDLDAHEASVEEKIVNKCAAECLARLPASFAPWWKDKWSHEKWYQMAAAPKATVEKDLPMVQRLAAMFVAEQKKVRELKQKQAEEKKEAWEEGAKKASQTTEALMKLRHEEVLTKIQRVQMEDMEAVKGLHAREMTAAQARYSECLTPLLGIRDKMRAECEKKCEDARRKGYAMGYAFADQKWNPVYKAVCEELELVRKEGANHQAGYIRLLKERDELILAQADLRQELDEQKALWDATPAQSRRYYGTGYAAGYSAAEENFSNTSRADATEIFQAMRAENKELRQKAEEDKQMVQRHLKEIAKENAEMTAWEVGRLREENNRLLELVNPTIKLMKSNPELFGGEALPSPRPPAILRLPQVKEEALVAPSLSCLLVESPPTVLPGIVDTEPCTEGMCMALTEEQYKEMFGADRPPPIVPDQPKVCGTAGCVDCPAAEAEPEPAAEAEPEPAAEPVEAEAKPKPNYNHPNWPSPITKRFAKHLAKHSGRPGQDPKSIKTHEDALEYIAKRGNISVETLLQWTMKHYQSFSEPWTLVEGPNKFNMGTAPATWWC